VVVEDGATGDDLAAFDHRFRGCKMRLACRHPARQSSIVLTVASHHEIMRHLLLPIVVFD
jgi:hypothetical protein